MTRHEDLNLIIAHDAKLEAESRSVLTRHDHESRLLRFSQFLGPRGLLTATTADIEAWLASRGQIAASTRSGYISVLHRFYTWVLEEGWVTANPAAPLYRRRLRQDPASLRSLLSSFRVAQERRGLARSTITKREEELRRFQLFLGEKRSVLDAQPAEIEAWLDRRVKAPRPGSPPSGLAARTRYASLSHLHALFKWARREGLVDADPTEEIDRPRLPRLVPRPISDDDLSAVLEAAPPHERAWVALAAYQGLRCQEIAGLLREDILEHSQPPLLIVTNGKGARQRILPLHPEALRALKAWGLPKSGPVFLVPAWKISQHGSAFLHEIGSPASMHSLRHWFGSRLYARTRDLRMVQEMLGHSSPTTTASYVAFNPGDAVDAVTGLEVSQR